MRSIRGAKFECPFACEETVQYINLFSALCWHTLISTASTSERAIAGNATPYPGT